MTKLRPFFTFYGGKNRAAHHYPSPEFETIVEPFAGSAGYSMNYPEHQVILCDIDPIIAGTWRYLIGVSEDEIMALPDLEPGQRVSDLVDLPDGAKWLIGWWLNKGSASPCQTPSSWMGKYPRQFWGPWMRERIAGQLDLIRHWRVLNVPYCEAPEVEATWFIDPPYQQAGRHYRHGSSAIDFEALAEWCKSRKGQPIVCEADDAGWLPFRPLVKMEGTEGKHKINRAKMEVIWP